MTDYADSQRNFTELSVSAGAYGMTIRSMRACIRFRMLRVRLMMASSILSDKALLDTSWGHDIPHDGQQSWIRKAGDRSD